MNDQILLNGNFNISIELTNRSYIEGMNIVKSIPRSIHLTVLWRCHIQDVITSAVPHYDIKASRWCRDEKIDFKSTISPVVA